MYSEESSCDEEWRFVPVRGAPVVHAQVPVVISPELVSLERVDSVISEIESVISLLDGGCLDWFWGDNTIIANRCEAWGIGSLDNSKNSIYQFALFVLILQKNKCVKNKNNSVFYDPVINQVDKLVIEHFGIIPNPPYDHNACTKDTTLLYMPHCDRTLYEWIIWNRQQNIFFISNFFSIYAIQYSEWESVLPFINEKAMLFSPNGRKKNRHASIIPYEAFNDLAIIHVTDPEALKTTLNSLTKWCKSLE